MDFLVMAALICILLKTLTGHHPASWSAPLKDIRTAGTPKQGYLEFCWTSWLNNTVHDAHTGSRRYNALEHCVSVARTRRCGVVVSNVDESQLTVSCVVNTRRIPADWQGVGREEIGRRDDTPRRSLGVLDCTRRHWRRMFVCKWTKWCATLSSSLENVAIGPIDRCTVYALR